MGYGNEFGLIKKTDFDSFLGKQERIQSVLAMLEKKISLENKDKISLKDYLKKPEIHLNNVLEYEKIPVSLTDEEVRHIEAEVKYEGYLKKQEKEIARILKIDGVKIPENTDFKKIHGLTREAIEKMEKYRPETVREMKKIPGLTPSDIFSVYVYLSLQKKMRSGRHNVSRGTLEDGE
jgi:tRNA uridine 5-carboxymethylaminomethyl modification enzyme